MTFNPVNFFLKTKPIVWKMSYFDTKFIRFTFFQFGKWPQSENGTFWNPFLAALLQVLGWKLSPVVFYH